MKIINSVIQSLDADYETFLASNIQCSCSYRNSLAVSFPGFTFPPSIFSKDHCLFADHRDPSEMVNRIKRQSNPEPRETRSPLVMSRRVRPGQIHMEEEHYQREDGVELVVMRNPQRDGIRRTSSLPVMHPENSLSGMSSEREDSLSGMGREKENSLSVIHPDRKIEKENSLPILDTTGVFDEDSIKLQEPPPLLNQVISTDQKTLTRITIQKVDNTEGELQLNSSIPQKQNANQNISSQASKQNTIQTNLIPTPLKRNMSEVKVVDYVFCVQISLSFQI